MIDKKLWISSPAPWMIDLCISESIDEGHNKGIESSMDISMLAFVLGITKDLVGQVKMKYSISHHLKCSHIHKLNDISKS